MALASTSKVVLGCIAFVVFWITAVFPKFTILPIGRTAGSLLGAALMVVFQVISPNQAFAAVDLAILGLLFGTMAVTVYLGRADLFKYLGSVLSWKSRGGKDLLCRVCLLSALSSALFTNDTICVVFTEFVLKICHEKQLHPQPFLMALATSANIGSAATAIGNPQNLVIAVQSGISFGKFLIGIIPAVIVGAALNTVGLLLFYWKLLSKTIDKDNVNGKVLDTQKVELDTLAKKESSSAPDSAIEVLTSSPGRHHLACSGRWNGIENSIVNSEENEKKYPPSKRTDLIRSAKSQEDDSQKLEREYLNRGKCNSDTVEKQSSESALNAAGNCSFLEINEILHLEPKNSFRSQVHLGSRRSDLHLNIASLSRATSISIKEEEEEPKYKLRRRIWKICVYLVTLGMLAALLYGLNLSWCAMTAAVVLMVLDFSDAGPSLDQVSYSLLVFFSGMFITVEGFNKTGIPGKLWDAVEHHCQVNTVSGIALLSTVVVLLSNVASNVPTVLLLGMRVAMSAEATPGASVTKAWLILAWVSTVAGNLTLVGSAANLIVSEQARRAGNLSYDLAFWNHLRFGVPSTVLVIAVGLPLIRG